MDQTSIIGVQNTDQRTWGWKQKCPHCSQRRDPSSFGSTAAADLFDSMKEDEQTQRIESRETVYAREG
jgi:hypothetical protein